MKKFAAKQTVGSKAGAHKFKTPEVPIASVTAEPLSVSLLSLAQENPPIFERVHHKIVYCLLRLRRARASLLSACYASSMSADDVDSP